MCGITGIWYLDNCPLRSETLEKFTDSLAHRGPDGKGVFIDPKVSLGLGHRRLAILDLSETGSQPMSYGNRRYWITYNGEIYNFIELRDELQRYGHQFHSQSDTEVILAAYAHWGQECQRRFNGMWAFAIWDRLERILFVSRDRFGVKPLLYFYDGLRFAFASEMKAFLALPWFSLSFDPHVVARALVDPLSIEGTEECLLGGIKRLPGGHSLTLRKGQSPQFRRWWNTLEHLQKVPVEFEEQAEQFRELFFDAVKIRMRSDVPLGTALSGGLDSSSVLCTMAQIKSSPLDGERVATSWQRAVVATYPGTTQDERAYAEEVVRHTGTNPIYKEIDPISAIQELDEFLFQFEEIQDIHIGPWMIYRELRREGIRVSLDGHGGDEALAGYLHYPEIAMRDAIKPWPKPLRLRELTVTLKNMYPEGVAPNMPSLRDLLREIYIDPVKRTIARRIRQYPLPYSLVRLLYKSARKPLNAPATDDKLLSVKPTPVIFADLEADASLLTHLDLVNQQLYYDFHFTVLPTILRNFDRCSMGHGVEVRAPFMDWRLVCYAFSLPATSKIAGGYTKRILREAMRGILPETIRRRTSKVGFCSPMHEWVKRPLKAYVLDTVNNRSFLESDIWNGRKIKRLIEESYKQEHYARVEGAWQFVQAMRLIELFQAKSSETTRRIPVTS